MEMEINKLVAEKIDEDQLRSLADHLGCNEEELVIEGKKIIEQAIKSVVLEVVQSLEMEEWDQREDMPNMSHRIAYNMAVSELNTKLSTIKKTLK